MNDDELISAYVDGRLSGPERAAFEARAQADAALRRRVAATKLLYREARQLPAAATPRNFILPRDFGQAKPAPEPRRSLLPAWIFRIGSIAAALLFAFVVVIDVARPGSVAPATTFVPAPAFEPLPGAAQATVTLGAMAEAGTTNVQPMAATVALPTLVTAQNKAAPGAAVLSSQERADVDSATAPEEMVLAATPEIAVSPEVSQRSMSSSAAASAPVPAPAPATATPEAALTNQLAPTNEPLVTPLRLLAVAALVAAVVLGVMGWLRR